MVEKSFLVINGKTVGLGGKASAKNVTYSNADTNLTSVDVQDAISELDRTKQEKLVGLRGQVVGFDELGNAVAQDSASEVNGKAYTTLEELGLDASATLNDAITAMPNGSSALFGVTMFTDYQNIFPYIEANDQYSRVYIVKSDSVSRVFCQWFRKDGAKSALANVDGNNQVAGWEKITLNPYNSNVYKTYGSVGELNAAKGTSITLVVNEDNTQKILDALSPREEFVEWFGNSNNRFGINPATFGTRINCIRITKMNVTSGYVFAMMDTGAVLNRVYAEGALGEWFSVGHKLDDGFTDDGTICVTGSPDTTGMYGNGVAPETLGMTRDIMTWDNGCYRLSHFDDLTNTPEGANAGRLEHFNLKRWQGNSNPHTVDWAERMSIFYSKTGDIYTRYQESGATAGVLVADTGWRILTKSERGLVTNAATFTINITRKNSAWWAPFKFVYMYKNVTCEINFNLTTALYYATKGNGPIESITYTINGAKLTIGIKFSKDVYGTQWVSFPSECGRIDALTKDEFTGANVATYLADSVKSYTSFGDLGIEQTATLQDVLNAMADDSIFCFHPGALPTASHAEYLNLTLATVTIHKRLNTRIQILMTDKENGDLYVGKLNSANTFAGWTKVCVDSTPTWTNATANTNAKVDARTSNYCVKNGICYANIDFNVDADISGTTILFYSLPKPAKQTWQVLSNSSNTVITVYVDPSSGQLKTNSSVSAGIVFKGSLVYPVA